MNRRNFTKIGLAGIASTLFLGKLNAGDSRLSPNYDLRCEQIKRGVERNVLVFDGDAKFEPSGRLLSILKVVGSRNKSDGIDRIIISEHCKSYLKDINYVNIEYENDNGWTEYYKSIDGTFPDNKNRIAIGICKNGQIILGTY